MTEHVTTMQTKGPHPVNTPQPGILLELPRLARYLSFSIADRSSLPQCLARLRDRIDGETTVAGLGPSLIRSLGGHVDGMKDFPAITAPGFQIDHAPDAVWLWLRGDDRGELLHRSRRLVSALSPAFQHRETWDAFKYEEGRDLSGYEDGTENPKALDALAAATVGPDDHPLAGSSFVATQRWLHDFDHLEAMPAPTRDHAIGRRQSDNEELEDAPPSAHVKRTAQESFEPEAFVLRRSMPWAEGMAGGLMFVAFGRSFDAFEAQLTRMTGGEDGIVDALFGFTRPVSGAYFWCPAMKNGTLDLSPIGI